MKGVSKKYPGTVAVDNVDFEARVGEVHAIMGENGAGKSTLVKILAGSFNDYTGSVGIGQKEVALHSPAVARAYGIAMIYQELSLARPISIAENLLVGRLPRKYGFWLDRKAMLAQAQRLLKRVGLDINPLKRSETSLRDHRSTEEAGDNNHLHLAPSAGGFRDRRPYYGPEGRTQDRHEIRG